MLRQTLVIVVKTVPVISWYLMAGLAVLISYLVAMHIKLLVSQATVSLVETTAEATVLVGAMSVIHSMMPQLLPVASSVGKWWFQVPQAEPVRIEPIQPCPWWEDPITLLTAATSFGSLGSAAYNAGLPQLGQ